MTKKQTASTERGDFNDAMRRLAQVPKAEVDAEEAKYRKMRTRLKAKKQKPPKKR